MTGIFQRKDESILTVMDQEYLLTESDRTKTSEIQIISPKITGNNSSTNQEPRRKSTNQSGRWRRPSSNQKSSNRETLIDSEKGEHEFNVSNTETNTEQITENTEHTEQTETENQRTENRPNGDENESTERDGEYTEHGERSEQVTKSYSTVTPSRAGSWIKPKVDYHPSLKQFNTLRSSQTVILNLET